jgi:SulP family sulfate permease
VTDEPAPKDYSGSSPFRRRRRRPLLQRSIPISRDLPGYRLRSARTDLAAGLTVAALAIPAGMAYAEVAGLSPVIGLYALLLPTVGYALLGSSRPLIVGPEGSISALVAVSVLALAGAGSAVANELAAVLALLVAACFVLARVVRLGWLADYLSRPVLIGYIHGVAIVLVIGQLGKLLGLDIEATEPIPQLFEVAREIGETSTTTLAIGALALAVLLAFRYLAPRFPAALVVVVLAIVASSALDLAAHGVSTVGSIPSGLPAVGVPRPPLHDVFELIPAALGLFLVSFADQILTARAYAGKRGEHVDVNQELLGMAGANAAAGFSQGLPVGASGSRTAMNDAVGAHGQLAGLIAAGAVALVLLFLTAPIEQLPKAVLGAAIIGAAIGLVDRPAWRELAESDHVELAIAAVTLGGVVIVGVLQAIVFAAGLSIVDVVRRSARPHDAVLGWAEDLGRWADVSIHRSAQVTPGVVVYRLDDRLFFANASYVKGRVREAIRGAPSEPRWLVLDAEGMTQIDASGLDALKTLVEELEKEGVGFAVSRLKSAMAERLDAAKLTERIGQEHFYGNVSAAVDACREPQPSA